MMLMMMFDGWLKFKNHVSSFVNSNEAGITLQTESIKICESEESAGGKVILKVDFFVNTTVDLTW